MRIAVEALEHLFQTARSTRVRPSYAHSTRRATSQPSQAPLPSSDTGKPQPPTRCSIAADDAPADAAGPDDDDAAILAPVGADACRVRVGGDDTTRRNGSS